MSQQPRNIWDDLVEVGRDIVDKIDEALHPDKKRQLTPAPIPIYGKRRHPSPDTYPDESY